LSATAATCGTATNAAAISVDVILRSTSLSYRR